MLAGLLQPNATYNPQIAIARNSWKRKNSPTDKKNNSFSEILVQIISGIMVGFILHICGIKLPFIINPIKTGLLSFLFIATIDLYEKVLHPQYAQREFSYLQKALFRKLITDFQKYK